MAVRELAKKETKKFAKLTNASCRLLSCALAGKPAEWACTAVNRVAYKDLSCVTSADYNAGHGAFFITTKKVSKNLKITD